MIDIKLLLFKYRPLKNGEYPIYLRLTKGKEQRYISTKQYCKEDEWNKDKCRVYTKNKSYKAINASIESLFSKVKNYYDNTLTIEEKEKISIDHLIKTIFSERINSKSSTNFFELVDDQIIKLKEIGKIGTAKWLHDSRNSITKFQKSEKLDLKDITVDWLENYEHFLRKNNCIDSGIAVKMRAIRSIYNKSMKNEKVKIGFDTYPFRNYQISKLKGLKKIRAVEIEDINKIKDIDEKNYPELQLAKNMFLFSYYTGGMNYIDLIKLTWSNIYTQNREARVEYIRSKTKGEFDFKLIEPAKKILEYYRDRKTNTNYVFPILLHENLTPNQIANRKHKTLTKFNKDLKEIGKICNINFDLTSYVARHSFASNLKYKNISTDVISEALGHQNIKVTQSYLKRFENAVIDDALKTLV